MALAGSVLICAVVLIICVASGKLAGRLGVPTLLLFILLGMLFGSDGLFKIPFEDFAFAEKICSVALIFIMFYGGFGTNWEAARPVAARSFLLSTAGVVATAALTGLFCRFALGMGWLEGMLVGSVIGSTDAASVFSILRSRRLGLKHGLASLLELESGSNDPTSYTLTLILLTAMTGQLTAGGTAYLIFAQLVYGLGLGLLIAWLSGKVLERVSFEGNGLHTIFVVGVALLAYAIPTLLGGNGYLSVYITGIVLGNKKILHKTSLVHFFDGVTWIMQIVIFFTLGLLAFPSQMPHILLPSVAIALFLTFVARPAAVFALLAPFRVPYRQRLLVSWAGLRGAASIVFAIMAVVHEAYISYDIFHIVFCVALLSVAFQGSLLPVFARKLKLVGSGELVLRTFNDYQDKSSLRLIDMPVSAGHPWAGRQLRDIALRGGSIAVMVRRDGNTILPKGDTTILPGDVLVISCPFYEDDSDMLLTERRISKKHPWAYQSIESLELDGDTIIVSIRRGRTALVPRGKTRIRPGDVVVTGSLAQKRG